MSNTTVFVKNLHFNVTEEDISNVLGEVGTVVNVKIEFDKNTGKPKGFAFATFSTAAGAAAAVRNCNGVSLRGRPISVEHSNAPTTGGSGRPSHGHALQQGKAPAAAVPNIRSVPQAQLLEQLATLKAQLVQNPLETRQMLINNPSFSYYILQAQIVLGMIDPIRLSGAVADAGRAMPAGPPAAVGAGAGALGGSAALSAQQAALLQQVASLTPAQIAALPDVHRQQVEQLRAQMQL